MTTDKTAVTLRATSVAVREATAIRNAAIREAVKTIPVVMVAAATGLTRQRIYQIIDTREN